jgi:hypothetical protein
MPSDDRERSFENALASHLRAGSSAGDAHNACSDAETLAAYHERSLAPGQMASLKAHVADCERCRQILAHLDATDEIPVAAANMARQEIPAAESNVRVLPARRPTLWRWVAPAGALAAALLVWVAVHENNATRIPVQATRVDIKQAGTAKDLPTPSPLSTLPPSLDATRKEERASRGTLGKLNAPPPSQTAGAPKPPPQSLLKQKDSSDAGKKSWVADDSAQITDNSLNREVSPVPEEALQSRTEVLQRIETAKADAAKIEAESKAANARRDALLPGARQQPAPAPAPARSAAAGAAPAASSSRVEASSEPAGVSGGVAQQREIAGMSKFSEKAKMRLANSISEVTIAAPGGLVSWRVGQAGVIEFSPDAGKTWTLQPSGVTTDLLGGSAPTDKVCWIVGSSGTILRTTDGGTRWQKLRAPVQDDIRAVAAVDARRATVSLTNGSYQTTDGGATWNKLAPE